MWILATLYPDMSVCVCVCVHIVLLSQLTEYIHLAHFNYANTMSNVTQLQPNSNVLYVM